EITMGQHKFAALCRAPAPSRGDLSSDANVSKVGMKQTSGSLIEAQASHFQPALDAGLLAAAQAVEHYEIARYGTFKTWASRSFNAILIHNDLLVVVPPPRPKQANLHA